MAVAMYQGKRKRVNYGKIKEILDMPNLIDIQRKSYEWFLNEGLMEVFTTHLQFRFYWQPSIGVH